MFSGLKNGNGPLAHGEYTASAGDATATTVALVTGLTAIEYCHAYIRRTGKTATSDAAVSYAGGTITVAAGSTYVLTAGDVIAWIAIGR